MKDRMELTWFEDDREVMRLAVDAEFLQNVFRGINAESIQKVAKIAERLREPEEVKVAKVKKK